MASRSHSMSPATLSESPALSANRLAVLFSSSSSDCFSIPSSALSKTVDKGGHGERLASAPGQLRPSPRLLGVSINRCCSDVLFEPVQLGFKTPDLLLDVFEFLQLSESVVHGGHPLDQYLKILDERAHPSKGGLERREP